MGDHKEACKWYEVPDVERYSLRGPTYLSDRRKVPASPSAFALHQARLFKTVNPLYNAAEKLPSLRAFIQAHPLHFFIVYNRIVPYKSGTIMNVISLLVRKLPKGDDPAFDRLFDAFVTGTEEFRNTRLKHLCSMRVAPSAVTGAIWLMGGEKPVIIGKGYIEQKQYVGNNFVEIDVDVSTSRTAKMIVGKVIDNVTSVVMEEMLVLEGQSPDELPERPLAAWRWLQINVDSCIIDLDESILSEGPSPEMLGRQTSSEALLPAAGAAPAVASPRPTTGAS